jgi:hypothetical protein
VDPSQPLDIDVDQFTGPLALVALSGLLIEVPQLADPSRLRTVETGWCVYP